MSVYRVKLWLTTYVVREVQAKDSEDAIEQCVLDGVQKHQESEAIANLEAMEFNNEAELCDSQYTDQQELKDRERDHEQ